MDLGKLGRLNRELTTQSIAAIPPDVGIFCSKCREFIQVMKIRDHRAAHKALSIFGYKRMSQVKSLDELAVRRVEFQQSIAREHRDSVTVKNEKGNLPLLRAPGRPRPPNSLESLVAAKREYLLIDEAYQVIRDYCFFDKSPFILKPKSDVRHCVGLPSLTPGIVAIGVAADQNDSYRPTMEDFRMLVDPFGPPNMGACLFGVFDGYNGTRAAHFTCKSIPHLLLEELIRLDPCFMDNNMDNEDCWAKEMAEKADILRLARNLTAEVMNSALNRAHSAPTSKSDSVSVNDGSSDSSGDELRSIHLRRALAKCILQADKDLATIGDELSLVRWSGCSATIGLLLPEKFVCQSDSSEKDGGNFMLYLADVGNCHALVIENGRPRMLTEDHTVENANEVQKVIGRGGKVTGTGTKKLVCGLLATTRGIGNYGQPELRRAISSVPHMNYRRLGIQDSQMIVIGTTGLWSVLSKHEVATIAIQTITYCVSQSVVKSAYTGKLSDVSASQEVSFNMDRTMSIPIEFTKEENMEEVADVESIQQGTAMATAPDNAEVAQQPPTVQDEAPAVAEEHAAADQVKDDQTVGKSQTTLSAEFNVKKSRKIWWEQNEKNSDDLPTATVEVAPGSIGSANSAKMPLLQNDMGNTEKPLFENGFANPQQSRTLSDFDVDTARTVALNLASAALLAGSQENVTVQILLLPNYRSLAEIHNRPLGPTSNFPGVTQSLQL